MNLESWIEQLNTVTETAQLIAEANVIDIEFASGHQLEVYVALSPSEKRSGLAHLSSIDTDGMLFYYDSATYIPFSMKDMKFDLDIAWFDKLGNLIQHGSYNAGDRIPVVCSRSFNYVLEVPKGTLPVSDLKING